MELGLLSEYGWLLAGLLLAGCATGFAAGLFGIGGGIVTVPVLYAAFRSVGAPDESSLKTAIGTSLAVIVVTSARSLAAHHRAGHVDREVLLGWGAWIAVGAAVGGLVARWVPVEALAVVFVGGAIYIALRRLRGNSGKAAGIDLNAKRLKIPVGFGAGVFSALMGLGGGAVGVMVMTLAGRAMHQAIATSAGFGLAVAVPGVAGFVVSGLGESALPPMSVGFVNLPGFAAVAVTAAVMAPIGARVAHRLDSGLLSRIFAVYVLAAAIALGADIFA